MTDYNVTVGKELLPDLLSGQDGLAKLIESVLNQVLEAQVSDSLGANDMTWSSICTHLVKPLFSFFATLFQIDLDSCSQYKNADDSSYKTLKYSSKYPTVPRILFDNAAIAPVLA
jgi:hypothetical protein